MLQETWIRGVWRAALVEASTQKGTECAHGLFCCLVWSRREQGHGPDSSIPFVVGTLGVWECRDCNCIHLMTLRMYVGLGVGFAPIGMQSQSAPSPLADVCTHH